MKLDTELEQSSSGDQIKGSVWDSVWVPEFNMKHLKKAKGHIGQDVMNITVKMKSKVEVFLSSNNSKYNYYD